MKVSYTHSFQKSFRILPKKIQEQFFARLELFLENPRSPVVKNHSLQGNLQGYRAFSITGDFRVIFRFASKNEIKLVNIGTHNQVY